MFCQMEQPVTTPTQTFTHAHHEAFFSLPPSHPPTSPGATVPQVAIAWLLSKPSVSSVVIGARTMEQLEDNLQSVNVKLTEEEVSMLALGSIPIPLCIVPF